MTETIETITIHEAPRLQKPTLGRLVHYVLSATDGVRPDKVGECRPAIIVRVWRDSPEAAVNLRVLLDGTNDTDGPDILWVCSVSPDENSKPNRTWHWPARED
jgi:hypothetical protein